MRHIFLKQHLRLLQNHTKRPDAIETFELLSELKLWNGYNGSKNEDFLHNDDLQNQLTQVTELLNQLKMQVSSSQPIHTNESSDDSRTDIPSVSIQHNVSEMVSYSGTNDKSSALKSLEFDFLHENDDKDKQIEILSNKLIESDKRASEMKEEIERLRDLIKQRNG